MPKIEIGNLPIDKIYFGNLPIDKIFYGNVEVYSALQQLVTPTISLISNNADLQITSTNEGEEKYEIYVNGVSIGTFNQGYTFLHRNQYITKCLGDENYTGVITTPTELDGVTITNLGDISTIATPLFGGCKASKLVISDGVTGVITNVFDSTTETVNIVLPSTYPASTSSNYLISTYPHNIIIGQEGYIEYIWDTSLPNSAFSCSKTLNSATTFVFDIKSTITTIGDSALSISTAATTYSRTFNIYFRQPNGVTVTFGTNVISKGSNKSAATYNIYTDNEGIKTTMESYADNYTTINVYKLDGSNW